MQWATHEASDTTNTSTGRRATVVTTRIGRLIGHEGVAAYP
ncbi:hypothetical protein ABZ656_04930 [Streptomyces sp. NPDC007095]